jgi:hypothetical protein
LIGDEPRSSAISFVASNSLPEVYVEQIESFLRSTISQQQSPALPTPGIEERLDFFEGAGATSAAGGGTGAGLEKRRGSEVTITPGDNGVAAGEDGAENAEKVVGGTEEDLVGLGRAFEEEVVLIDEAEDEEFGSVRSYLFARFSCMLFSLTMLPSHGLYI